jgi:hypothetical protein
MPIRNKLAMPLRAIIPGQKDKRAFWLHFGSSADNLIGYVIDNGGFEFHQSGSPGNTGETGGCSSGYIGQWTDPDRA